MPKKLLDTMEIDIDHRYEEPILPGDPEYLRRYRDATSAYAALEIEAWQLVCAEETTTSLKMADQPARQGGDRKRLCLQP